jgi:transporter family protein
MVLAIATVIAAASSVAIAVARGELSAAHDQIDWIALLWACATGIALTVAVSSLFRALSLGPVSIVMPLYGIFVIGGAALGVLILHEPMTWQKSARPCRRGSRNLSRFKLTRLGSTRAQHLDETLH